METVNDVYKILNEAYPVSLAEEWDNVGFLAGRGNTEVKKILLALDITKRVISEASEKGCNLIVSHHPVIFTPRRSVTDGDVCGEILLELIENGISAICMHTNLDAAENGVNDALAEALGIEDFAPLDPSCGIGRYGRISQTLDFSEFLRLVCEKLKCSGVKYHDAGRKVKKLAVGGGACGDYIRRASDLGCDTFVTADVKHNQFLEAEALGINVIDAGHFATEDVVIERLYGLLSERIGGETVIAAENDTPCTDFFVIKE